MLTQHKHAERHFQSSYVLFCCVHTVLIFFLLHPNFVDFRVSSKPNEMEWDGADISVGSIGSVLDVDPDNVSPATLPLPPQAVCEAFFLWVAFVACQHSSECDDFFLIFFHLQVPARLSPGRLGHTRDYTYSAYVTNVLLPPSRPRIENEDAHTNHNLLVK
jgi:hypothetical protein